MTVVRELRREADTTQAQLARIAGTSQPTIAAYKSGRKSPTLTRMTKATGLDPVVTFVPAMTREDRRSLAIHRAIADRLREDRGIPGIRPSRGHGMRRSDFDHATRAAGSILGENEVLVIGSQAIHGSIRGDLPEEAERSLEVNIAAFGDTDASKADLIDGAIGEASMFHETFCYHAKGVTEATAVLPDGWQDRPRDTSHRRPAAWSHGALTCTICGWPRPPRDGPRTTNSVGPLPERVLSIRELLRSV